MKQKKAYDNTDFMHSREARTLRILSEYMEPEKRFAEHRIQHTIVFFGSARIQAGDRGRLDLGRYYRTAEELAYNLALLGREMESQRGSGLHICTGGGGGIMEAANRGASRAGAETIGLNISLPFEQTANKYITPQLSFEFHYFFMRKLWFLYHAKAIIIFPGGFGTMDELFETLTLMQTRKLDKIRMPLLLHDRAFWEDTINFEKLIDYGLISPEDLHLFQYFETAEEGMSLLKQQVHDMIRSVDHYLDLKYPG
ncbi:MAG: LOG family protein [Spirochaetes bacterium]|nr:LOG family protein [Spirochaetota bacterium]